MDNHIGRAQFRTGEKLLTHWCRVVDVSERPAKTQSVPRLHLEVLQSRVGIGVDSLAGREGAEKCLRLWIVGGLLAESC